MLVASVDPAVVAAANSAADPRDASRAWSVLALVGAAFLLSGLADLALAWLPPRFGDIEWEFGTVSSTLNNLAVPSLGLALVAAKALATRLRALARIAGAVALVLLLCVVCMAALYGLTLPVVLRTVQLPAADAALRGAAIKAAAGMLAYSLFFGGCAWVSLRAPRAA